MTIRKLISGGCALQANMDVVAIESVAPSRAAAAAAAVDCGVWMAD